MRPDEAFNNIQIVNLGTGYDWTDKVRSILMDPKTWNPAFLPSIPLQSMHDRLHEIKCICLVEWLTIQETRTVFPALPGKNHESSGADFLGSLLNRMLTDEDENDEENGKGNHFPASSLPHYGCPEGGNEVTVVVDCYGMYVSSLRKWLSALSQLYRHEKMHQYFDALPEDGPAVLLCPELIATIPGDLLRRAARMGLGAIYGMDHGEVLNMTLLKLTLLHEFGHHMFPVHMKRPGKYICEAMANWFVYCMASGYERLILHEKTRMQTLPYRMYEGILPILHPAERSWLSRLNLPASSPDGRDYAVWLEQEGFSGEIKDPRFCSMLKIGEEWYRWLWSAEDTCEIALHAVHPAEVMALMLMNETIFFGVSDKIQRLEKSLPSRWSSMLSTSQYGWLERMWSLPRSPK